MVLAVFGQCTSLRVNKHTLTSSQLEGLLTFVIGFISYLYLPFSPTRTKGPLWRRGWYTEREEVIMVNRILRDDPAKGVTALKEPATFRDIIDTWKDKSMWGLYFIGLVAYIPASPVQGYLSLTLRRIGFSKFDSNMLSIPSAVLQIILMLALAFSSNHFMERTWHCIIGEFWCLPLLVALLTLPAGGHEWGRFTITTMIAGCEYFSLSSCKFQQLTLMTDPYFHPIVSAWISENSFDVKKRAITAATYNVIVQVGSVISSRKLSMFSLLCTICSHLTSQSSTVPTISLTTIVVTRSSSRSVLFLWSSSCHRESTSVG
jgi:hypothetical protein